MAKGFKLEWKGAEGRGRAVKAIIGGVNEFHIGAEKPIKEILQPMGKGVITGTLRRSIHADAPTYTWASDDVVPSPTTPERMATGEMPQEQGNTIVGTIGSGLVYAAPIHKLYQYITRGYEKHQPKLLPAIQKHARLQGLK